MSERQARNAFLLLAAVVLLAVAAAVVLAAGGKEEKAEGTGTQNTQEKSEVTEGAVEEIQQTESDWMQEKYGCDLYGVYEYPFNQMSQDWSAEQVEGFCYHEITDECKREGGTFPVIMQVYTYIVCRQYGVEYEVVFALIEHASKCVWNAEGDDGTSVGYMQIVERWHRGRMERLGVTDLKNPFSNILVGVDFIAELQLKLADADLKYMDILAAYNYGLSGAKKNLWDNGVHQYSYNTEIMARAEQLKAERTVQSGRREEE